MHGSQSSAPRANNLLKRSALRLGPVTVNPATREFIGPAGTITVRPQVMLVFVALLDAGGQVVAREDLLTTAWGGRFVAEDSLNGAISELRRAVKAAGFGQAVILTVPKTGYRLQLPELGYWQEQSPPRTGLESMPRGVTRRSVLVAGTTIAAGSLVLLSIDRRSPDDDAERSMEEGLIALQQGLPNPDAQGVDKFLRATELAPDNARAWGLLALALGSAAEYARPDEVADLRTGAEAAARRALTLDRAQADAWTALALLTPSFGRWFEAERGLRAILATSPHNDFAVAGLATLLMSTGQVLQCLALLDWLVERNPRSPNLQFRRVYTLWSAGRTADADVTANRALQSWPKHPAVWFARFNLFAFTDRAHQARAMLADLATKPPMPPQAAALLELSLAALAQPGSATVDRAIAANVAAATRGPSQAITAIMVLSSLGAGERALEVARGFLMQQGDVVVAPRHTRRQASITDQHHRMTMMLWIPATANLRREPGFLELCSDIGLTEYWRERGVRPDTAGPQIRSS